MIEIRSYKCVLPVRKQVNGSGPVDAAAEARKVGAATIGPGDIARSHRGSFSGLEMHRNFWFLTCLVMVALLVL